MSAVPAAPKRSNQQTCGPSVSSSSGLPYVAVDRLPLPMDLPREAATKAAAMLPSSNTVTKMSLSIHLTIVCDTHQNKNFRFVQEVNRQAMDEAVSTTKIPYEINLDTDFKENLAFNK